MFNVFNGFNSDKVFTKTTYLQRQPIGQTESAHIHKSEKKPWLVFALWASLGSCQRDLSVSAWMFSVSAGWRHVGACSLSLLIWHTWRCCSSGALCPRGGRGLEDADTLQPQGGSQEINRPLPFYHMTLWKTSGELVTAPWNGWKGPTLTWEMWKNELRDNLSVRKCFNKLDRLKTFYRAAQKAPTLFLDNFWPKNSTSHQVQLCLHT